MIETTFMQQFLLAAAELAPMGLAQSGNYKVRRFDCIAGILLEPYWMYYGWKTGQWAITLLGFGFLLFFGYGFYHKWILPHKKQKTDNAKKEDESCKTQQA